MMLLTYISVALAVVIQVDSQTNINSTVLDNAAGAIEVFSFNIFMIYDKNFADDEIKLVFKFLKSLNESYLLSI